MEDRIKEVLKAKRNLEAESIFIRNRIEMKHKSKKIHSIRSARDDRKSKKGNLKLKGV